MYFDKCCSESDSLGDLETTKGQIESVSQTFVPSIINAPLLFSLSDPFNLFSIAHISFFSANITRISVCFSASFFISCFSLMSLAFLFHFSHHPVVTCWFFRSYMYLFNSPFPCLSGFPLFHHMLAFCLLVPSGIPSISSSLLLCLDWFFLRSNISLINNGQETGCFYNSEITLLSPTPP